MADARDLYGLPLERFVPERAALAKEQRAAGERERSAQTAKLRKPSVAAWAVNQLVRTQKRKVAELFKAGDRLQRAQSDLIAGRGDARKLRDAVERERAAVDDVADTARGLLSSEGQELSATTLERVRETLHAAALDDDARANVHDGCLVGELRHVGIGDSGAPTGAPTSRAKRSSARRGSERDQAQRDQAERRKAERTAAAERKAAAAQARRKAERAAREVRAAQERRDRAAAALERAEAELAGARERAKQAGT